MSIPPSVRDRPGQPSHLLGSEAETLVALLLLAAYPGLYKPVLLMFSGQQRSCGAEEVQREGSGSQTKHYL